MSKPPKVKPYSPYQLEKAKRFIDEQRIFERKGSSHQYNMERALAALLGKEEELGWNHAMVKVRAVLESVTLVLSPDLFNWSLKKTVARLTAKEKKT